MSDVVYVALRRIPGGGFERYLLTQDAVNLNVFRNTKKCAARCRELSAAPGSPKYEVVRVEVDSPTGRALFDNDVVLPDADDV